MGPKKSLKPQTRIEREFADSGKNNFLDGPLERREDDVEDIEHEVQAAGNDLHILVDVVLGELDDLAVIVNEKDYRVADAVAAAYPDLELLKLNLFRGRLEKFKKFLGKNYIDIKLLGRHFQLMLDVVGDLPERKDFVVVLRDVAEIYSKKAQEASDANPLIGIPKGSSPADIEKAAFKEISMESMKKLIDRMGSGYSMDW